MLKKIFNSNYSYRRESDGDRVSLRRWSRFYYIFILWASLLLPLVGASSAQAAVGDSAQMVSQSVPTTMTGGVSYPITIVMKNTGTTTWTAAANYLLGTQNPLDNTTFSAPRRTLPSTTSVAPGQQYSFVFTVIAPKTNAIVNFQWGMLQDKVSWFPASTFTTNVPITVSTPAPRVTLTTTGAPYAYGGAATSLNVPFSGTGTASGGALISSLQLYIDFSAGPTEGSGTATTATYAGSVAFPHGTHTLQLKATDSYGATAFSPLVSVPMLTDDAVILSQSTPTSVIAGSTFPVTTIIRNAGTSTWTAALAYAIGTQGAENNLTWGKNRVAVPSSIGPGATATFTFQATAPSTLGLTTFQWQMVHDQVAWFGPIATNSINVIAPPPPTVGALAAPANGTVYITNGAPVTVVNTGSAAPVGSATIAQLELLDNSTSIYKAGAVNSFNVSKSMALGTHKLQIRATDSFGAVTLGPISTITVALTPPNVSLTSPVATTYFAANGSASVPIIGIAISPRAASIAYLEVLDFGQMIYNLNNTGTINTNLPMTVGPHTIQLRATDGDGRVTTSAAVQLTVSPTPPPEASLAISDDNAGIYYTSAPTAAVPVSAGASAFGTLKVSQLDLFDNGSQIDTKSTNVINASYSLLPGPHQLQVRVTDSSGQTGWSPVVNATVTAATAGNSSKFLSQNVPLPMVAGQPYTASITMVNTGTTTWDPSTGFKLGAQTPQDNRNWVLERRAFLTAPVATGQQATFTIAFTAPPAGSYTFQWQMLKEGTAWFGAMSDPVPVTTANGAGPTATLAVTPTNARLSSNTITLTFTGNGTAGATGRTISKLELFEDTGTGFSTSAMRTVTGAAASLNFNVTSLIASPGVYWFKLRATDDQNVATDSSPVLVNVADGGILGLVSGVRIDANNNPQLVGWACQSGYPQNLSINVYLDAPTTLAGGTLLTTGTANVSTENDNAAVQTACGTPYAYHDFVIDLSSFSSQYAGRPLFVQAVPLLGNSNGILPCNDNTCTMPGTLRIGLTTPADKSAVPGPASIFMRAQLSGGTPPYDEVDVSVDGNWIVAAAESTAGAYSAMQNNVATRIAPYAVQARVRQGNSTVYSSVNMVTVGPPASVTIVQNSPPNDAIFALGVPISLQATPAGSVASVASVQFYYDTTFIGAAVKSGGIWTYSWTPSAAGSYNIQSKAFDGSGKLLGASAVTTITVSSALQSLDPTPIAVAVQAPHLNNPNAGTLPGSLSVGNDGASTYNIALPVPPGTAGVAPQLSLNYSSNGSNGMVGLGWSLGGFSTIHRCAKTVAQDNLPGRISLDNTDRLCLDGQRLIRSDGANPGTTVNAIDAAYWAAGAQYRTELESFARVTRQANGGFKVETRDGKIQWYGTDSSTAFGTTVGGTVNPPLFWALARTEDRSGNYILYSYNHDTTTGEYTPHQIRYGGNTPAGQTADLAVNFSYSSRNDPQTQYMGGERNDMRTLLTEVKTVTGTAGDGSGGTTARDLTIKYINSTNSGRSLVSSMQVCGGTSACLPATNFDWGDGGTPVAVQQSSFVMQTYTEIDTPVNAVTADVDGSGLSTLLIPALGNFYCHIATNNQCAVQGLSGQLFGEQHAGKLFSAAFTVPNDGNFYSGLYTADLDGDGRDDLVLVDIIHQKWAYCLNTYPTGVYFASCQTGGNMPLAQRLVTTNNAPSLVDMLGDGRAHVIVPSNTAGQAVDCVYQSGAMKCTSISMTFTSPISNVQTTFSGVWPIDFSKQGMSDFYSIWNDYGVGATGISSCFDRQSGIACQVVDTRGGPSSLPYVNFGSVGAADLNGDGLTDFIYSTIDGSTISNYLCLSTEVGIDCRANFSIPDFGFVQGGTIADFLGDGVSRVLAANLSGTGTNDMQLCRLADGVSKCQSVDISGLPANMLAAYKQGAISSVQQYNWDASGVPGVLVCGLRQEDGANRTETCWITSFASPAMQDKIIRVTNGIGQREEVDYARGDDATVYQNFYSGSDVGQPVYPLESISPGIIAKQLRHFDGMNDAGGNPIWLKTNYQYSSALRDATGRGSLGFAQVQSTDLQTGTSTVLSLTQPFPFTGMVNESRVTANVAGNAVVVSDTVNTLEQQTILLPNGASTFFTDIKQSVVKQHDLDGSDMGVATTVNQYTDGWGNLNSQTTTAVGSGKTFSTATTSSFYNDGVTNWLLGLRTGLVTTRTDPDSGSVTRSVSDSYDSTTGLQQSETVESGTATYQLVTTFDRSGNPYGLVNKVIQTWTDPACGTTGWPDATCVSSKTRTLSNTIYDRLGRFPSTITNALTQTETHTYDAASGEQTSLIGANGLTTTWSVDGYGRVTKEVLPGGNETRTYFKQCAGDCPATAVVVQVTDRFNGPVNRISVPMMAYSDTAGHIISNRTYGFAGDLIDVDQTYDDINRVYTVYQPRFDGAIAYLASQQSKDVLNRVTSTVTLGEDGKPLSTSTKFQGLVSVQTNAKNQTRTETRNVTGELVQVTDAVGGTTQFGYDSFGNLAKTTDPMGNVITVVYDRLGRKTELHDPDLGFIAYSVDPIGQTWKQVTPNLRALSKQTSFVYDLLGRMTARYETDLESHWVYDTANAPYGVGQLAEAYTVSAAKKDYDRVHVYDTLGRLSLTTQTLSDGAYKVATAYDAWSRVLTQTYTRGAGTPKAYDSRYNNYGYLALVANGTLRLWELKAQDAARRPILAVLGNGLTQTNTYNLYSARMTDGSLQTAAAVQQLSEGYQYDSLGNVSSRSQHWPSNGFQETFTYDGLNRLSTSQLVSQSTPMVYTYDKAGSILTKTGEGTGAYVYPAQGASAVRPHAVQSITGVTGTFSYDADGNQTAAPGRTASWSSFDMPVQLVKGTALTSCASFSTGAVGSCFVYGSEHQRTKQVRDDGTSLSTVVYAEPQESITNSAGQVTVKTYWPYGLGVEINRPGATTPELSWFSVDRLGSVVALTDGTGALTEQLGYNAWGQRRTSDGETTAVLADDRGFTGEEMLDPVGLVHLNGRVYDPLTAKFLSADPYVTDPTDGQNYSRYSYVLNNPVNLTDPTGYEPAEVVISSPCNSVCQAGLGASIGLTGNPAQSFLDNVRGKLTILTRYLVLTPMQLRLAKGAAIRAAQREVVAQAMLVAPLAGEVGDVGFTVWNTRRLLQDVMQAVNGDQGQDSSDAVSSGTNSATGDPNDDDKREKEKSRAEKRQEKIDKTLKDKNLPTQGNVPYEPPKNWNPSEPLPRGNQNGIMDKYGREWTRGPSRTQGEHFEWDVQLKNGEHLNVDWSGKITH